MFVREIIKDSITSTVIRMTGNNDLNSNAVRNLLGNGRLQLQMKIDLVESFKRHIRANVETSKIDAVFLDFSKNPLYTVDQLIDMLSDVLDEGLKEDFVDRPNYKFFFFILVVIAMTIPFWIDYFNFHSTIRKLRTRHSVF